MSALRVAALVALQGCALVADLDAFGPAGEGGDPSPTSSTGAGGTGGSGGAGGASPSTTTTGGGSPCATDLLITEVRTKGPGGSVDELVEIFNPTNVAVDLSNLKIVGRPLTSMNAFGDKWTGAGTFIEPQQRLVVGGSAYSEGTLPEEFILEQNFSDDQSVALVRVDGASTIELDRVDLCCDDCADVPSAAVNPACDPGDVALSLHRVPACVDGVLVAGPPTPFLPEP